jgi:hypothetical protein
MRPFECRIIDIVRKFRRPEPPEIQGPLAEACRWLAGGWDRRPGHWYVDDRGEWHWIEDRIPLYLTDGTVHITRNRAGLYFWHSIIMPARQHGPFSTEIAARRDAEDWPLYHQKSLEFELSSD